MQSPVRTRMQGEASGLFAPVSNPALLLPVSIGLDDAVAHPAWREAGARIQSRALAGPGVILLTGAPGSGKTLLLQDLAQTLRQQGVAVAVQPDNDFAVLAPAGADGRAPVVMVDNVDLSAPSTAEGLRNLKTCVVVLAGPPEAPDATTVALGPLQPDQVMSFMAARLARAGLPPDLFSPEAIDQLALRSAGAPRALNTLANASLLVAHIAKTAQVSRAHVQEAEALGVREAGPESSRMVLGTDAFGRRKRVPTRVPDAAVRPTASPPPAIASPPPRPIPVEGATSRFAVATPGPGMARAADAPPARTHGETPAPLPPTLPRYATLTTSPHGGLARAPLSPRSAPRFIPEPRRHRGFALAIGVSITLAVAGGWVLADWNHIKPPTPSVAQTSPPIAAPAILAVPPAIPPVPVSPPAPPQEAVAPVQPVPLASTPVPDATASGQDKSTLRSPKPLSPASPPEPPLPTPVRLPKATPLRIVLHYARTGPEAAAPGTRLSTILRAAGYPVGVAATRIRPDMHPAIRFLFPKRSERPSG